MKKANELAQDQNVTVVGTVTEQNATEGVVTMTRQQHRSEVRSLVKEGSLVIDSKMGVQNTRKLTLSSKQEGRNCSFSCLTVTKFGVVPSIIPMSEIKAVRDGHYTVKESISVPVGNGFKRITKKDKNPYTTDVFVFSFENVKSIDQKLSVIYVKRNQHTTKFVALSGNECIDILTDKEVKVSELFREDGTLKRDVRVYKFFGYSVSQLRGAQCYMIDVTKGLDVIESMLNELTYGAYMLRKGEIVNLKGLIKFVARMFQWTAPSKSLGNIGCYAIINDVIKDELGNLFADGTSFGEDEFYAACLTNVNGVLYTPQSVRGEMLQTRPFTAKQSTVIVSKKFITYLMAKYECVRFTNAEVTPEIQQEIMDGAKGIGRLAGKMVIIGEGAPQLIMDRNAIKADYDFSTVGTFDVLAIAKKSNARTSRQMLQKALAKNEKETLLMVRDLCFKQFAEEITKTLVEGNKSIPAINAISSLYLQNVAAGVASDYVLNNDRAMFKGVAKSVIKRMAKALNKLGFNINGFNSRVLPDIAKLFSVLNLLKFDEVFNRGAERYFKESGKSIEEWICALIKYPAIGDKEFHLARVVSLKEMKARIKARKFDRALEDLLIEYYSSLSDSITVVAAVEELKDLCAGMDFDMDPIVVIVEEAYINILKKDHRFLIVKIVPEEVKAVEEASKFTTLHSMISFKKNKAFGERTYEIGLENFVTAFIEQIRNGNKSVGEATNMAEIMKSLARYPKKAKELMLKSFTEGSEEIYVGITPEEISIDGVLGDIARINEGIITRVIEEIQEVTFSDENIAKIFFDFDIIFRYYVETIIDAAKSGKAVNIRIEFAKFIWALSLTKIDIEMDWANKQFIYETDAKAIENKEEVFEDLFYKLKVRLFEELKFVVEGDIMTAKQEFTTEQLARFEKYAAVSSSELVDSISMLKRIYNDTTGGYITNMSMAVSEDMKLNAKEEYKEDIAMISHFGRMLTKDFSPIERARVAKYSSLIDKSGIRKDGGSQFASIVFPEEYLLMLDQDFSDIHFAGEKLLVNKGYKEGDVVEFTHGISELAIIDEDITGTMVIREFKDVLYAAQDIKDIVVIPAIEDMVPIKLKDNTITGREEEIKALLNGAKEVFISAKTTKKGVADFAIYVIDNGSLVKVAGIDTRGKNYNRAIDGMKASIVKFSVHDKVKAYGTNKEKTSIILFVNGLDKAEFDTSALNPIAEGSIEIGTVIENDNSL